MVGGQEHVAAGSSTELERCYVVEFSLNAQFTEILEVVTVLDVPEGDNVTERRREDRVVLGKREVVARVSSEVALFY